MSAPFALWVALALLLAWALGGYNRLVRLRAQVIGTFAPVDHELGQAIVLLPQGPSGPDAPSHGADPASGSVVQEFVNRAGLSAAAAQLEHSLRIARRRPLDANAVAALKTAYATVHALWQRQEREAGATWSATAPLLNQRGWENSTRTVREAIDAFNQSVTAYNAAIAQFPAVLLAHLFNFGPAACL